MTNDTRDHTPVSVTLPAYAWGPVLDAVKAHARRLTRRAENRPAPDGSTANLDQLQAEVLADVAEPEIYRASPRGRRAMEVWTNRD